MRIAVIGAGILGRTVAYFLAKAGVMVQLFEQNNFLQPENCSAAAAGMLSPFAEISAAMPNFVSLGLAAIAVWEQELNQWSKKVFFDRGGTLCVAHPEHKKMLLHHERILIQKGYQQYVQKVKNQTVEPELEPQFIDGLFFPMEAQINAQDLMTALAVEIEKLAVEIHSATIIQAIKKNKVVADTKMFQCDWVVDCRGLGAKNLFNKLRGVKGELLHLHAPTVNLARVIRILNREHPIYIIPRPKHHYIVGASNIETEQMSSISVKTALTLLTFLFNVHKGFTEASIIKSVVHCRPAFDSNLPKIIVNPAENSIHINGLYRHGYMFAPIFAKATLQFFQQHSWDPLVIPFVDIM